MTTLEEMVDDVEYELGILPPHYPVPTIPVEVRICPACIWVDRRIIWVVGMEGF